jgi:hypothetical protein
MTTTAEAHGGECAKVFFSFPNRKWEHRMFIEYLRLECLETLPPEWSDISLQIRQCAKGLGIAVSDEDTDLAILERIDIAIGNVDLEKLEEPFKVKGKAMKRQEAMSPEERKAEIEAKRIARDREILTARRVLQRLNAPTQPRVSIKPREHRTMGKAGAGTGAGGDEDPGSSDEPASPGPGARAHVVHPLISNKPHKPKYHNRRVSRRSWRVSRNTYGSQRGGWAA